MASAPPQAIRQLQHVTQNAYRILGLSGSASSGEVSRQAERFLKKVRLGPVEPTQCDLPWLGPVKRTEGTIQEALGRLNNPVQRLRERLFWFHGGQEAICKLSHSADGFITVLDNWTDSYPENQHDRALLLLLAAVLFDSDVTDVVPLPLWTPALTLWNEVVDSEVFWDALYETDLLGDFEPTVTDQEVEQLRAQTLFLVSDLLAGIARDALANGYVDTVQRALGLLAKTLSEADLLKVQQQLLGSREDKLEELCSEIKQECDARVQTDHASAAPNRIACEEALTRFGQDVEPTLTQFLYVAGKDSESGRRARAAAAECLRALAVYWTWTNDFVMAETLLRKALGTAEGTSAAPRIEEVLTRIADTARQQRAEREASQPARPARRPSEPSTVASAAPESRRTSAASTPVSSGEATGSVQHPGAWRIEWFTQNAYRILGLPGAASQREMRESAEAFQRFFSLGGSRATPWDLPWLGPVERNRQRIHDAMGRLKDPVQRLRERLFWFWEGEEVVARVTVTSARNVATGWRSAPRPAALHDAALLTFVAAILQDPELFDEFLWVEALRGWQQAVAEDDYWETVAATEQAGGFEPSASDEEIAGLRREALSTVTDVLIKTAIDALPTDGGATLERVHHILMVTGLLDQLRIGLSYELVTSLEDRLDLVCREIQASGNRDVHMDDDSVPVNRTVCTKLESEFDQQADPLLRRILKLAGPESDVGRRARETAVECLRSLAIQWTWADGFTRAEGLLERAEPLAAGTSASFLLEEQLREVRKAAEQQREREAMLNGSHALEVEVPAHDSFRIPSACACCLGTADDTETVTGSQTESHGAHERVHMFSLKFPICRECKRHNREFANRRLVAIWGAAAAGSAGVASAAFLLPNFASVALLLAAGLPVAMSVLLYLNHALALAPLPREHAGRGSPVSIVSYDARAGRLRFRFANPRYGLTFARLNAGSVQDAPAFSSHRGSRLLKGPGSVSIWGWSVALVTAGTMAVHGLLPSPSARQPSGANTEIPTASTSSQSGRSLNELRSQIEEYRSRIDRLEQRHTSINEDIEGMKKQIDRWTDEIDRFERLTHTGMNVDRAAYQQAIDSHNALVPRYNLLISDAKKVYAEYQSLISEHNRMVEEYNKRIKR